VEFAMMETTDRNCVLVADLSAERARLGESEVMRLAWRPATDDTGLRCDKLAMLFVAEADHLWSPCDDQELFH
jgi:hypothetical protein